MTDREALEAALEEYAETFAIEGAEEYWLTPSTMAALWTAARERLAQIEDNVLVIPRDADGNWPLALLDEIKEQGDTNPWVVQSAIERWLEGTE